MKKFLFKYCSIYIFFLLMVFLSMPGTVFALANEGSSIQITGSGVLNPIQATNLGELLAAIFNALIAIGIPIAILMLVYSGFLFVTAMGDEKQVGNAKENFKWTVIGIAILLGAKAIVLIVKETVARL